LIDEPDSDARLRRIFGSPLFRHVIVTQSLIRDYLIAKDLCLPEKISFIYGVVTPELNLRTRPAVKSRFGFGKDTLDICFTAHKYTADGHDKGFDFFLDVARKLVKRLPACRFHVVGGHGPDDLPLDGLEGKIAFHGPQEPSWFDTFYRDKDMILLGNVPFVLLPGAFDGFPTGCGSDAMLHELALLCTDPLKLNCQFVDGQDLVIIEHDIASTVEMICALHDAPERIRAIGESGCRAAKRVYSFESQLAPRLEILKETLQQA
jgi:glycosyltransferase involved in cell wall biosynthesis